MVPDLIYKTLETIFNTMDKSKILIVEDDYDTQLFLKLFLRKNFDVEVCGTDETLHELLKKSKFDLIIMDIEIKGQKDGLQITRELKNSPKYKDIPVLCISAYVMEHDKRNALEAGVDKFLAKPISNNILMKTILELLHQ